MADGSPTDFLPRIVRDWPPGRTHRRVPGALVFVDISGFTALSERLAGLGREGAERVTAIIDAAFAELLVAPYELGASLLSFGGDAMLLLFRGEDDVHRAVAAAAAMRDRLPQLAPVRTPAGEIRLGMSGGVHAGDIDLFLVGGAHRTLLVTGPAATGVVDAEASAGSGNVVVSDTVAARLPPACLGERRGPGCLLRDAPHPIRSAGPIPALPTTLDDLDRLLPVLLRDHLASPGRDRSEHRRAAVAFCHFDGTDDLVARHPEEAAERLDELVRAVQRAAEANEVCLLSTDVDHDGGKIVLSAGAPRAHEDDVDRMLLTVRAVLDAPHGVPVRIGVHAGPLLAAEVGPERRRFYTVMGDTVNTAARVMARAGADEALVTDTTLGAASVAFGVEAVPPFAAKGKAEPIEASRLGARRAEAGPDADTEPQALVGRDALLADLARRMERSLDGAGGGSELVGGAGMGKTALARAVLGSRPDLDLLVLRCHHSTQQIAYGPVEAALRRAVAVDVRAPTEALAAALAATLASRAADRIEIRVDAVLRALGRGPSPAGDVTDPQRADAATFARLVADTVDQVLRARYPRGVVVAVENGQWVDEQTAGLLRRLVRRPARRFTISTRRPEPAAADLGLDAVEVGPLQDRDATALAVAASGERLLPAEARKLVARTGGNPMFLSELARLAATGVHVDELPATLESVFAARLDRLDAGVRAALRGMAVLGVEFSRTDAAAALSTTSAGVDEIVAACSGILVQGSGRIRFLDTLVQDAAYQGLAFQRRRNLHGRVAEHLERSLADPAQRAEELAGHFHVAGDRQRCGRYATVAADRASARHADAAAARFARMALDAGVLDPRTAARMWRLLGEAAQAQGRFEAALEPYRRARSLVSGDPLAAAAQALDDGELRRSLGDLTPAIRWFRRGRRLLEGAPAGSQRDALTVRLLAGEGIVRGAQGRLEEAGRLLGDAMAVAERAGDEPGVAHCCLWLLQTGAGAGQEATLGRRAIATYEALGAAPQVAWVHNALGNVAQAAGDLVGAVDRYRRAAASLEEAERSVEAAVVSVNVGSLQLDRGDPTGAAEALLGAARTFRTANHPYLPYAEALLACARDAGSLVEASAQPAAAFGAALDALAGRGLGALGADLWRVWLTAAAWRRDEAALAQRLTARPADAADDPLVEAYRALVSTGDDALALGRRAIAEADDGRLGAFDAAVVHAVVATVLVRCGEDAVAAEAEAGARLARLGLVRAPFWPS